MNANTLSFRKDGTFKILQVSDPQDLVHPRKAMLQMLNAAYDKLRPDLVLFTGDNTLGNHLLDFGPFRIESVNNPKITQLRMKRALAHILQPVEDRGVPFAMIYGNHDDMNDVSKKEQFWLYRRYRYCLPMNENDDSVDCDTYNIPLLGSDGTVRWNLYLLDSAWNDASGQYWRIKEETVCWYLRTSQKLKDDHHGQPIPSLLFLHEALPQIRDLLKPCANDFPGAVEHNGQWFCLNAAKATGVLGEYVSPCEDPYGLFAAIRAQGDVRAVVSGHDHANCFDGTVDGVRMLQTGAASFRCYGSRVRGVRLFTLHEDAGNSFETQYFTYDMLCGTGARAQARYFWDADDKAVEKYTALGCAAITAGVTAGAFLFQRQRMKKQNQ